MLLGGNPLLNRALLLRVCLAATLLLSFFYAHAQPPEQEYALWFQLPELGGQLATVESKTLSDLGSEFTLETWVFFEEYPEPGNAGVLMARSHPSEEPPWPFWAVALVLWEEGFVGFMINSFEGAPEVSINSPALPLHQWVHIAATLGDGEQKLYINGSLVNQISNTEPPVATTVPLTLGHGYERRCCAFSGFMAQAGVWDVALDEATIRSHLDKPPTGAEPDLLAFWPLDDGTGVGGKDKSEKGHDLVFGLGLDYRGSPLGAPEWIKIETVNTGPYFESRHQTMPLAAVPGDLGGLYSIDLDSDGDADLVNARTAHESMPQVSQPIAVYRNDGDGNFTDATEELVHGAIEFDTPRDGAIADFTGDGLNDLIVVDHGIEFASGFDDWTGGQARLLVQQLGGGLADETQNRLPIELLFHHGVTHGDIDKDGDIDFISANVFGSVEVYINDGAGVFSKGNDRLPEELRDLTNEGDIAPGSVELVDFDNDNDLDLFIGVVEEGSLPNTHDIVLLNNGLGTFDVARQDTLPPRYLDPSWGTVNFTPIDVNRDGYQDLLVSNVDGSYSDSSTRLLINNQDGTFRDGTENLPAFNWPVTEWVGDYVVDDFNADGWPDFIPRYHGCRCLFLNDGTGRFIDASEILPVQSVAGTSAGNDADGDGDVDIIVFAQVENLWFVENLKPYPSGQNSHINAGHAGAWFNPDTSGQGQLIDVDPAEQSLFVSWFTFTDAASDNPNEQHWYTAEGNYTGNTAELILYETLGGRFNDPQPVSTDPVGTATLSFTDCGHGQMHYDFDNEQRQGSFPLQRVIPGSNNVCEERSGTSANATEAVNINPGMDGAWYDTDKPGQGFFIDAHTTPEGDNFIFVAWFTYGADTASGQRWLTAQGDFEGSTAPIDIYEITGGSFDDLQLVDTDKVGTMTIDFTDCSNAQLTYSLTDDGIDGDMAISRLIPGGQALCEELAGAD